MKVTVPIPLDVNLTPDEIICYLKQWIYHQLKIYQYKSSNYWNSTAVVRNNKLYWQYQKTIGGNSHVGDGFLTEQLYEEIPIEDEVMFNICKNAVLLLNSYQELKNRKIKEEAVK